MFQIAYFFFVLLVRTAAALPKCVLLHTVCIQLGHTTGDFTGQHTCNKRHLCSVGGSVNLTYLPLRRGLWVRIARKACWLAYCKMRPDVVGHPGIFGILHLTYYYVLGHTKYGILSSMVVWVLERSRCLVDATAQWFPTIDLSCTTKLSLRPFTDQKRDKYTCSG